MEIIYLGHSSFKLRGKSVSVITDPYDSGMVGLKYPSSEADIVTVSHDHKDHNQSNVVKNVKKVIFGAGEYEIARVSIIGISQFHDAEKGEKRGKNIVYIYEMDDFRLCHLGDLGHTLSDEMVGQIGDIDVLMIPVGGFYTIGPKEAIEIIGKINPYFVIPMHYKVPGINQDTFSGLLPVEDFLSNSGLSVEKTQKFTVKKSDIMEDQSTKVIVLLARCL
ncbi:MAG: MBL fold metallo-hydrolase [bacterium]|nr:MBL fold metallo-hydrolase [bacterium]